MLQTLHQLRILILLSSYLFENNNDSNNISILAATLISLLSLSLNPRLSNDSDNNDIDSNAMQDNKTIICNKIKK